MSVDQVCIKFALGGTMNQKWNEGFDWVMYWGKCILFYIPLCIQRKRLLGRVVNTYLTKGKLDYVGKCVGVEVRGPGRRIDTPFVYMIGTPDNHYAKISRSLRAVRV